MEVIIENDVGLSRVSGYYGPGAVSAWWCLTLSAVIAFVSTRAHNSPKRAPSVWNLFNLDPVVLAITAYPCVASFDLLYNLRTYTADSHNVALYCAPLLVLLEAKLVMTVLIVAISCREAAEDDSEDWRPLDIVFASVLLFYFCIVYQIALMVCIDKVLFIAFNSLVPWAPWAWDEGASYISTCEQNLDRYIKGRIYPEQTDLPCARNGLGVTDYESSEKIMMAFGLFLLVITFLQLSASGFRFRFDVNSVVLLIAAIALIVPVTIIWMFLWVLFWGIVTLLYNILLWPVIILLDIAYWRAGTHLIPQSAVSFLDLDQMAAFFVGGLVPLIMSVAPSVRRIYERSWRRSEQRSSRDDNNSIG